MAGYTKLFGTLIGSSLWRLEPDATRLVWITMLAMANREGVVEASVPGLADFARVGLEECRDALRRLGGLDPESRSAEYGGRRIEAVDGGWRVLNHAKYREKMSCDDRREYMRQKQAEYRERAKQAGGQREVEYVRAVAAGDVATQERLEGVAGWHRPAKSGA